jgi:ABC-type glycerol-3-phosphate transport system substrate-binding protein
LDVLRAPPACLPDLVGEGLIRPFDEFEDATADVNLEDFHGIYRRMGTLHGKRYGYCDDGDCIILYYRKDILEQLGLAAPGTWPEFVTVADAISEAMAPKMYGCAPWLGTYGYMMFLYLLRANEGECFDIATMKAGIASERGVHTLEELVHSGRGAFPGSAGMTPMEAAELWIEGRVAMTYWWPPLGGWYAERARSGNGRSSRDVGYSLLPGGGSQIAGGAVLSVCADAEDPKLAYAFIRWLTSREISFARVRMDAARTDPYRRSHLISAEYRAAWPGAGEFAETLMEAGRVGVMDLSLHRIEDYMQAIQEAIERAVAGEDARTCMKKAAASWNLITRRVGADRQRTAYEEFLASGNSETGRVC